MSFRMCPRCGHECAAEAILCVRCGTDLRTGRRHEIEVEESRPWTLAGLLALLGQAVRAYFPGLLRPGLLVFLLLTGLLGLGLVGAALALAMIGAVLAAFPVGALGFLFYVQALAWLIGGDWELLAEHLAGFTEGQWLLFGVLALAPFVAVFVAVDVWVL